MGKKRKLRKQLRKRGLDDGTPALVVCVGKHCCDRETSRAVLDAARTHAGDAVRVIPVGCLDICKKGPIVALYPDKKFEKRTTPGRACELVDQLRRHG